MKEILDNWTFVFSEFNDQSEAVIALFQQLIPLPVVSLGECVYSVGKKVASSL